MLTVGENKKADILLSSEGLPTSLFPLVRKIGSQYVLTLHRDIMGEFEIKQQTICSQSLFNCANIPVDPILPHCLLVPISSKLRCILHMGGLTFAFQLVSASRKVPYTWLQYFDLPLLNTLMFSFVLHCILIISCLLYPYDVQSRSENKFADVYMDISPRIAKLIIPAAPKKQFTKQSAKKRSSERITDVKSNTSISNLASNKKSSSGLIKIQIGQMLTQMKQSKLLQTMPQGSLAAKIRLPAVARKGLGVWGFRSITPFVRAAKSGLSSISIDDDIDTDLPAGGFSWLSSFKKKKDCRFLGDCTQLEDIVVEKEALPKALIKKVITENRGQIRYCYENELQRDHDLVGKVLVRWVIGKTGHVVTVQIQASTLNNTAVEACLQKKIKGWRFPAPAGGGIVVVNYPFIFSAI